eukprot:c25326_g1_i1 orf=138-551(+)
MNQEQKMHTFPQKTQINCRRWVIVQYNLRATSKYAKQVCSRSTEIREIAGRVKGIKHQRKLQDKKQDTQIRDQDSKQTKTRCKHKKMSNKTDTKIHRKQKERYKKELSDSPTTWLQAASSNTGTCKQENQCMHFCIS